MSFIKNVSFVAASTAFSTQSAPDDFSKFSDKEQDRWIADHKWVPFKEISNQSFYDLIESHSQEVEGAIHATLLELEDRLIMAQQQGTLVKDFGKLNLKEMLDKA